MRPFSEKQKGKKGYSEIEHTFESLDDRFVFFLLFSLSLV